MRITYKKRIILESILLVFVLIFLFLSLRQAPEDTGRPATAQSYHMQSKALIAKHKYKDAESAAQKAIALDNKFAKAYIDLGNIYVKTANFIKAIKHFQKALEFVGADKANREVIYYDLGVSHEAEKDAEKSWEYYRKAYQCKSYLGRQFWPDKKYSATYYVTTNDKKGFKDFIESSWTLPRELRRLDLKLQLSFLLHNYKAVALDSKKYLEDNPGSNYSYLFLEHLASAFIELGKYSQAEAVLGQLDSLALPPKDAVWLKKTHAYSLYKQKKYEEALEYLDSVAKIPDREIREMVLLWKSLIYKATNELNKEEVILNEIIRAFPESRYAVSARAELSSLYLKLGDYLRSYDELVKSGLLPLISAINVLSVLLISALLVVFFAFIFRVFFNKKRLQNLQSVNPLFKKIDSFIFYIVFSGTPWLMSLLFLYLNYSFTPFFKLLRINLLLIGDISSQIIIVAVCLFFLKNKYKLNNASIGFVSRGYKFNILLPLATTIVSIFILVGFGILVSHLGIPKPPPSQLKYIIQTVVKERSLIQLVFLFITGTIIVPIAEEIIFRGYLLNFFKNHTNTVFAVIASAFLFALSHETLLFMPYFIVLGLILAVMYVKTKTIIPCMVTHGLYNLVVMALGVLIYYLKS